MKIDFPYGDGTLQFEVADSLNVDIKYAKSEKELDNPTEAIKLALEKPLFTKPLRELLINREKGKICVIISDSTRPVPSKQVLLPIFDLFNELLFQSRRYLFYFEFTLNLEISG